MSLKKSVIKTAIATSVIFLIPTCLALSGYYMVNMRYQLPETVIKYIQNSSVNSKTDEMNHEDESLKLNIKTLYYVYNEENNQIEAILLELLNCITSKMVFLTIPTSTKVTVSNGLYQTMKETYVSVPQIMKLAMLYHYFGNEDAYTYGMNIMEEAFDIDIDYYSVINIKDYDEIFETNSNGVEVIREKYISSLDNIVTKKRMKNLMLEFNDIQKTNDSMERRMKYLETYESLGKSDISFEILPGEQKNEAYVPDVEKFKRDILNFFTT